MTHVEAILAEVDLQTVAIRATQLSTIAMEKSLRMPHTNSRRKIATAEVRQRTKKTSWRKNTRGLEIYLLVHKASTDTVAPATMATKMKPRF